MYQFSNFCSATLKSSVTSTDTTITFDKTTYQIIMGSPHPFPVPTAGNTYHVVLEDTTGGGGGVEVMEVTAFDGDETLTVNRTNPMTVKSANVSNFVVELRVMSAALNNFLQKDNLTSEGYYDFENMNLSVDELMLSAVAENAVIKVGNNTLTLPKTGRDVMWNNRRLQTEDPSGDGIPVGAIMPWHMDNGDIPPGWRVCDGAQGTPDLIGRFVIGGVPNSYVQGDSSTGISASDDWKIGGNSAGDTDAAGRDWWYPSSGDDGGVKDMRTVDTSPDPDNPVPNIPVPKHTHTVTLNQLPPSLGIMAATIGTQLNLYVAGDSKSGKYLTDQSPSTGSQPVLKTFDATILAAKTGTGVASSGGRDADISEEGVTTSFKHEHTIDITPPYYALVYIMKVP